MNFFSLIYAFIKKNLKTIRETEDSDERKKLWLKIVIGILCSLVYGFMLIPQDISIREIFYALGILFITFNMVFRALKYFKLI